MPKLQRPDYERILPRVISGELTRKQAATLAKSITGLSEVSFLAWLSKQNLSLPHGNTGNAHPNNLAKTDPDKARAYSLAARDVKNNVMSGAKAAAHYGVSYVYLMRKIAKQGQPPKPMSDREFVLDALKNPDNVTAVANFLRTTQNV